MIDKLLVGYHRYTETYLIPPFSEPVPNEGETSSTLWSKVSVYLTLYGESVLEYKPG